MNRRVCVGSLLVLLALRALACGGEPKATSSEALANGRRLLKKGKHAEALKLFSQLIDKDKALLQARLGRAEACIAMRKYEEALQDADEITRADEEHPYARFIRGAVFMRNMETDKAIERLEQAAAHPAMKTHVQTHFCLAGCLLLKGRSAEAIKTLDRVVKIDPTFIPARLVLIDIYREEGKLDEAFKVLGELERLDPKNAEVRRLLDEERRRRQKEAEEAARREREGKQRASAAASKEAEEALAAARQALAEDPTSIPRQIELALELQRQKKPKEAIEIYKRMIQQAPTLSVAYNNLAWLYITQTDELKKAEPLALKALELAPADPRQSAPTLDTVAWLYYRTKRVAKALPLAEKAIRGAPDNAELRYHLGMIYHKLKQNDKAAKELAHALKLDPKLPQKEEVEAALKSIRGERR